MKHCIQTNRLFIRLVFVCLLFYPCTTRAQKLLVAASANARQASESLAARFHTMSGIEIQIVNAASGTLFSQISQGAPYALFLSADTLYPSRLERLGKGGEPMHLYAKGRLILYSCEALTASNWQAVLMKTAASGGKIGIANPDQAPYGKAALEVLEYFKLLAGIKPALIKAESISQLDLYLSSRAVSAGFSSAAFAYEKGYDKNFYTFEIPQKSYRPILQGMLVLKNSDPIILNAAGRFRDFILSADGQAILSKHGYLPAKL